MRKHDHEGGFTLVEIMTVVLIIGILAAIAIPMYQRHVRESHTAAMKSELATSALLIYQDARANRGVYTGIPGTVNLSENTVLKLYTNEGGPDDPADTIACLEGYAKTNPDAVWMYSIDGRTEWDRESLVEYLEGKGGTPVTDESESLCVMYAAQMYRGLSFTLKDQVSGS